MSRVGGAEGRGWVTSRRAMFRIYLEGRSPGLADGLDEGCERKGSIEGADLKQPDEG